MLDLSNYGPSKGPEVLQFGNQMLFINRHIDHYVLNKQLEQIFKDDKVKMAKKGLKSKS